MAENNRYDLEVSARGAARVFVRSAAMTIVLSIGLGCGQVSAQSEANSQGLQLLVDKSNSEPALLVVLPGQPRTDRSIQIIFPEHLTARRKGSREAEQLYLFRPGTRAQRPAWRRTTHSLEYERDFDGLQFLARATIKDDGLLVHYEFTNHSNVNYEMIYAVTDPRLTGIFHDVRLERTYVHHKQGFDLLASETPERLTMPLQQWLPARYLASYTWPVPAQRVERGADGITYYYKSRPVDLPVVATVSSDRKWVVASFSRTVGNVWSNPQLTCQHVDPDASLAPGEHAVREVKILVFRGSLDEVLQKVKAQRASLN